jgi:hypothetical protein
VVFFPLELDFSHSAYRQNEWEEDADGREIPA